MLHRDAAAAVSQLRCSHNLSSTVFDLPTLVAIYIIYPLFLLSPHVLRVGNGFSLPGRAFLHSIGAVSWFRQKLLALHFFSVRRMCCCSLCSGGGVAFNDQHAWCWQSFSTLPLIGDKSSYVKPCDVCCMKVRCRVMIMHGLKTHCVFYMPFKETKIENEYIKYIWTRDTVALIK